MNYRKFNIKDNIENFLQDRNQYHRYASFDFCFNYFRAFYEQNRLNELISQENKMLSCLQLGFYLASWGMYRGSTEILYKSVKVFEPIITAISQMPEVYWEIDVDSYTINDNMDIILECAKQIKSSFNFHPTGTLITKIMLGVFGNIPALDEMVTKALHTSNELNENKLKLIYDFYYENKESFNDYPAIKTLDFYDKNTERLYTKAKLIDMACFIEGLKIP